MYERPLFIVGLTALLAGLMACGDDATESASPATPDMAMADMAEPDAAVPSEELRAAFTHKMVKRIGEGPFPTLAYECPQCTFEQWASIEAPEGWSKGPAQIALFSAEHSEMRSYPMVEDHPDSVDFLEEVPGNEYRVIAITLEGTIERNPSGGIMAQVQVQRDTRLVFTTGMRVHELTDPEGSIFVLFVYDIDPVTFEHPDFQSADALGDFTPPEGWTYATRVLDEDLVLDSNNSDGVVTVLALRGAVDSTWEKR